MKMIKTYRDLRRLNTFEDRFEYLKLGGIVGRETFGFDRYINQVLYNSPEWKQARTPIIIRDHGCDLGILGREIHGKLIVHHINPITIDDIESGRDCVFDPDNLICVSHNTHQAITYGNKSLLIKLPQERRRGDTSPWRAY